MKTWEYKLIDSNVIKKPGLLKDFDPEDVEAHLNQLGQQGWEIIFFNCSFKVKKVETFYGVAKREAQGQALHAGSEQGY